MNLVLDLSHIYNIISFLSTDLRAVDLIKKRENSDVRSFITNYNSVIGH